MSTLDRRSFLTRGAAAAGTAAVSTTLFQTLNNVAGASRSAVGHHGPKGRKGDGGYGLLARTAERVAAGSRCSRSRASPRDR